MKIQTFSAVIGTPACDADCSFCISHITGFDNLGATPDINCRNFEKAVSLARSGGCTTMLFTGKGEPTLYPEELSQYLEMLDELGNPFPFVELQTNALQIGYIARGNTPKYQKLNEQHLRHWWDRGLNTICISVTSLKAEENAKTYRADYPDLATTVKYLHDLGYSVRLCVMMENGKVDTPEKVFEVAAWCKEHGVAQCTVRPIRRTKQRALGLTKLTVQGGITEATVQSEPDPYGDYVDEHGLTKEQEYEIREAVHIRSELIMTLMHGNNQAEVYDVDGQNLCITDCLTLNAKTDDIRTLIFYSDGKIMYNWQFDGARLL